MQSQFCQEFDNVMKPLAFEKMLVKDLYIYKNKDGVVFIPVDYQIDNSLLNSQPIQGIRIYEDLWHNKTSIVLGRIYSLLGKNQKVHGRHCEVHKITQPQAEKFLQTHHLMGSTKSAYKYGLFYKKQLLAVMTFAKARTLLQNHQAIKSFELIRFATFTGVTVTGGFNKLLQQFIEDKQPDHLMTYADNDWGTANAYNKLGFVAEGKTTNIDFWVNPNTHERSYKRAQINNSWIHFQTLGNTKWIKFCK